MCRTLAAALSALLVLASAPAGSVAMDVPDDEWPRLKACEQRFCTMILKKEPVGDDLACKLSKTWAQETLKGGETKTVRWGFGDARCALNFNLARSEIMAALTKPEHTIQIASQTVKCEVDRNGELKPVIAKLAPKLVFKNGRAEKVWINLTQLDGPADIKGTVWMAANLEDSLGIFHSGMIKSINKFLHKKCITLYGPGAMAKALKKVKAQQRRAAAKAAKASNQADAKPSAATAAEPQPEFSEPANGFSNAPTPATAP